MIDKLQQIENQVILGLLNDPNKWKSLMIDYHPPVVERIWTQIGNYRVLLHWIHQCEAKDALFHPHPWPSAMHVISGRYEMGLGYGPGLEEPPKMCTILMEDGGSYYDMTHIDGWHYVRPVGGVCTTAMLIGPKWEREEIKSDEPLKPLPENRKMMMLEYFRNYYLTRNGTKQANLLKDLKHGDWVILEDKLMTAQEKLEIGKYTGQMAFVIKTDKQMAHIRFKDNNDRILSHFKNLTLLDPKDKPVSNDSSKTETKTPSEVKTKPPMVFSESDLIDEEDEDYDPDLDYNPDTDLNINPENI